MNYIERFERLGFGMFVHFGLYSQLVKGEWALASLSLDKTEYEKLNTCNFGTWRKKSLYRRFKCKYQACGKTYCIRKIFKLWTDLYCP